MAIGQFNQITFKDGQAPALNAANLNALEDAVKQHDDRLAKSFSELNRVFSIDGNNIPQFPDNAAGVAYKNAPNWSTGTDGWEVDANTTISVVNGELRGVSLGGDISMGKPGAFSLKQIRFVATSSHIQTISLRALVNGTYTPLKTFTVQIGVPTPIDYVLPDLVSAIYIVEDGTSTGDYLSIKNIYIGSGLFDSPVYGADGQTVWENHGVLPVPGKRGKSMLYQKKQYLLSTNATIGTTGTIAFAIKRNSIGTTLERIISNINFTTHTGFSAVLEANGSLTIVYGTGTAEAGIGTGVFVSDLLWHNFAITYSDTQISIFHEGALVKTFSKSVMAPSVNPIYIGRASHYDGEYFNGVIDDVYHDSVIWSADDVLRYYHGVNQTDCQVKSATGTPNALATFAADGFMGEHGTFTPIVSFGYNSAGVTYEFRNGYYNRIGKTVFFTATFKLTNKGTSTSNFRVGGLPFTAKSGAPYAPVTLAYLAGVSHQSVVTAMITENTKMIDFFDTSTSGAPIALIESNLTNDSFIMMSGFYFIN